MLLLLLQNSEHNRSLDDLDEEESHAAPPPAAEEPQEDVPAQVVRCGGEDADNGGAMSQRQRLNADMADKSVARRGRGEAALEDHGFYRLMKEIVHLSEKECLLIADEPILGK